LPGARWRAYDACMSPRPTPARRVALPLAAIATSLLVACQSRPAPETAARAYLDAWHRTDYPAMYALTASASGPGVSEPQFVQYYRQAAGAAGLRQVTPTLGGRASDADERAARFTVAVQWDTDRVGTFGQELTLPLRYDGERWVVEWHPGLLLAGLAEGETVDYLSIPATRGGIVDTIGRDLASVHADDRYPGGTLAAHVLGFLHEAGDGPGRGDEPSERGEAGLERWGEAFLAGASGGRLIIRGADGRERATVATRPPRPGATLELTLDRELQRRAEALLGNRVGAIVALDPRDGAVLALASRPTFDPSELGGSREPPTAALLDRATEATYPIASLFKVVAMAAGLESGEYDPASPFRCTGLWRGLGSGPPLEDSVTAGHGALTLSEGLVQSCNVVFYEVAKRLDDMDPNLLPAVARGFGLGAPTGLVGLDEAAGTIPDPRTREDAGGVWSVRDAAELAIGHGGMGATPLQVARLYAALANGGTLRAPVLVRQVVDADGRVLRAQGSEPDGRLPLADEHLAAIQAAMRGVVAEPRGTAAVAFRGFPVPAAGKTGSAESDDARLHAWFVGYAPIDAPEIVVVALVEHGGGGGETAAPLVRGVLEAYFSAR
jgi:cell division protein FtsI/penicillin-binding protein 2